MPVGIFLWAACNRGERALPRLSGRGSIYEIVSKEPSLTVGLVPP